MSIRAQFEYLMKQMSIFKNKKDNTVLTPQPEPVSSTPDKSEKIKTIEVKQDTTPQKQEK